MKKIAIITITNSGLNFGNRLQNYALQHELEKYSANVQTIFSAKNVYNSLFLSRLRRIAKVFLKTSGRQKHFNAFNRKYIKKAKQTRYEHINDNIFKHKYDAFITGSDQVWNPEFHFNSEFEFLTFAEQNKRFSYSASFGVDEIPEIQKKAFSERLNGMQCISVREEKGRDIVKQLSGRNALVHIDPTMLPDKELYAAMEEKPDYLLPEKYLLKYFLGEQKPEYITFVDDIATRLNLPVIELSEIPKTTFYNIGPQHFLYLLRHAEYICTDSFHGTIFAIIFCKMFTTFYRRGEDTPMHSRLETLLGKFGLKERLFGILDIESTIGNISYDEIGHKLAEERAAASEYLRKIVNGT